MNLANRLARCQCGKTEPSDEGLAFFKYRGPGSEHAKNTCAKCGYFYIAHSHDIRNGNKLICESFKTNPNGHEFDSYYCGCRGWD